MLSGFVNVICEIGIFMICTGAIINFRPKASYEKYLKMLVSAMVMVQLFVAIGGVFSPEGKMTLLERMAWFAGDEEVWFLPEDLEFRMEIGEAEEDKGQETSPIVIEIPPIAPISISDIAVSQEQ